MHETDVRDCWLPKRLRFIYKCFFARKWCGQTFNVFSFKCQKWLSSFSVCYCYVSWSHGLPESALHEVARATTLARLLSPLQPGGASPVLLTGHELNVFCNEQSEWGIFRMLCRMPLSWSQRLRLDCWLRLSCGLITFFDHYFLQ